MTGVMKENRTIRGLYAVTPDETDTPQLMRQIGAALSGGARIVQYRNKTAPEMRKAQARALKTLCDEYGAVLIINDHLHLAAEINADGVHLGAEDGDMREARSVLGPDKLIGVSCYNRIELARSAAAHGADYIAFGSFFPSRVKPGAVQAPLSLLAEARRELRIPIVAIGGITLENAPSLIHSGADAVAVISGLFHAPEVATTARAFNLLFDLRSAA